MKHLISLKEAAEQWHVSERTVRQWCLNGLINATKIEGTWVIDRNQQTPTKNFKDFKVTGLKAAVKNFNEHFDIARIYFDPINNFVWTAFYNTEDEMDYYQNVSAVEIYNKIFHEDYRRIVTEEQILMLCYDEYLTNESIVLNDFYKYTFPYLVK